MIVKLLTEHHLEFPSFKGGCTGQFESTHVKMPHCWKSRVTAKIKTLLISMATDEGPDEWRSPTGVFDVRSHE